MNFTPGLSFKIGDFNFIVFFFLILLSIQNNRLVRMTSFTRKHRKTNKRIACTYQLYTLPSFENPRALHYSHKLEMSLMDVSTFCTVRCCDLLLYWVVVWLYVFYFLKSVEKCIYMSLLNDRSCRCIIITCTSSSVIIYFIQERLDEM